MNSLFNSALRQSSSIRKDLDAFVEGTNSSPALQGQISASLTSFARVIDEYNKLAKQEPVETKKDKAVERVKNFKTELSEYRDRFDALKKESEVRQTSLNRTELLGRRPHHAATTENPYSNNSATLAANSPFAPKDLPSSPTANPYSSSLPQTYDYQNREDHAFRENNFMQQTGAQLDEFLERGRAVLGDLGQQRDILKGTQRRLYDVGATLGISGDTIRMVERRAKQDKWIFWVGALVFFGFCYLVISWLR